MKRQHIVIVAALFASACHLDDSNRCGDDYAYDADAGACIPEGDTETETGADADTDADTDADADAGADGGIDTDTDTGTDTGAPTGLMEPCTSQEECAGYDASYCMLLMTPNVCLLPDCTTAPDDCPDGYTCCDIKPDYEPYGLPDSLCVPDDDFPTYASYCVNG
jgi:hypothetical protein